MIKFFARPFKEKLIPVDPQPILPPLEGGEEVEPMEFGQ